MPAPKISGTSNFGSSFVPRSPVLDSTLRHSSRSSTPRRPDHDEPEAPSGLNVEPQQLLEAYKGATEQFILQRYYDLELSIEGMLKKLFKSFSPPKPGGDGGETPQGSPGISNSSDNNRLEKHLDRLLAHLDTLIQQPSQTANLNSAMVASENSSQGISPEQFMFGVKSMEATFERETNKQCDMISTLARNLEAFQELSRLSGVREVQQSSIAEKSYSEGGNKDREGRGDISRGPSDGRIRVRPGNRNDSAKAFEVLGHYEDDREEKEPGGTGLAVEISSQSQLSKASLSQMLSARAASGQGPESHLAQAVGMQKHSSPHQRHGHLLFSAPAVEPRNSCHSAIQQLVHNPTFIGFMEVLILANVGIKVAQMDIDVRRAIADEKPVTWTFPVDMAFTGIYVLELLLRIISDELMFFRGHHWGWNVFDMFVVIVSTFETITNGMSVSFLRIVRSVRLIRMLKVIRGLRFFRELRLMAVSIASCLVSLFWALVLILLVVICFAMFCLEGSKDLLQNPGNYADEAHSKMVDYYGSFPSTVYSLVQSITGGGDWGVFAWPLVQVSWMYGAGFVFFISFVTLGMMNILVGIFVENAQHYSQLDKDLVIQEEMSRRESYMNQLRDLFHEMDEDKSGTITYEEFHDCLSHERAKAYLDFLQLDAAEVKGLFMLLDLDENGQVGVEEFVLGCMRFKGTAKSIDAASMMYQTKRIAMKVNEFYAYTREHLKLIENRVNSIERGTDHYV